MTMKMHLAWGALHRGGGNAPLCASDRTRRTSRAQRTTRKPSEVTCERCKGYLARVYQHIVADMEAER